MTNWKASDPDSIDVSNPAEPVQPEERRGPCCGAMCPVGGRVLWAGMFWDRDELDLPELDESIEEDGP